MSRARQHLGKIAHFGICAHILGTDYEPDEALRKFRLQASHHFCRGIVSVLDAEQDFVLWIILQAMTAKAFVHLRVSPLERLKDGNRRGSFGRIARSRDSSVSQEFRCGQQAHHVIANTGQRAQHCDDLDEFDSVRKHRYEDSIRTAKTQWDRGSRPSKPGRFRTTNLPRQQPRSRSWPRTGTSELGVNSR